MEGIAHRGSNGDKVIISGEIGNHGVAILPNATLPSASGARFVLTICPKMLANERHPFHVDPTRGVATTLKEAALNQAVYQDPGAVCPFPR
jgi:hydrogenase maturation factor